MELVSAASENISSECMQEVYDLASADVCMDLRAQSSHREALTGYPFCQT